MMEAEPRLAAAFATVFETRRAELVFRADVRFGPVSAQFRFRTAGLAETYPSAFLPATSRSPALAIAVLTGADIDLAHVVPIPATQPRALIDHAYLASWSGGADPVLHLFQRASGRGLVWLPEGRVPAWEASRPACPLIQGALLDSPWFVLHAAAVARDRRVLLLAGKGGAGKTTAALACLERGWAYAGDDYVLANAATGEIAPLYTSARLRPDMAGEFERLVEATCVAVSGEGGSRRHELALGRVLACGKAEGGMLAAILLPQRKGAPHPRFTAAGPVDAFRAMPVTTSLGTPSELRRLGEKLGSLVARAPVHAVDTGESVAEIPDAFAEFLSRL
ncbi:MAG: hypothetical protein KIT16_18560 [Rhodospirillaceae bacterium]|nr:hypothetical protein [Rhodospirillaceae bacterium]